MAIFEDAMRELAEVMQAEAAVNIIYHRGNSSTVLLGKCWVGRTKFRVSDEKNSRVIWSDRDFIIPCADLKIDGIAVEPQEGDWIEQTFSNPEGNQIFEFMNPPKEPFYRYSDPQRTMYRVHTKRVIR